MRGANLELYKISESYEFSDDDTELNLLIDGPEGTFHIALDDHRLSYVSLSSDDIGLYKDRHNSRSYYLAEAPDWDYIFSLLERVPRVAEAETPKLILHYSNPETGLIVGPVDVPSQVIEENWTPIADPEQVITRKLNGFNVTQVELGWPIMPEHYT